MILPGALTGLGCGLLSRRRSVALGCFCGVFALALGIYTEWRFAPFVNDDSLSYFLTHLQDLRPITMILIALGVVFAVWLGLGGIAAARRRQGE